MLQAILFLVFVATGVQFVGYFLEGGEITATQLTTAVGVSDTTITVESTQGFPKNGYLYIQNETMKYTRLAADSFSVQRGAMDTTAKSHPAGVAVASDLAGGFIDSPADVIKIVWKSFTWDFSMFSGSFSFFRILGTILSTTVAGYVIMVIGRSFIPFLGG
jgi:hypothetical protein